MRERARRQGREPVGRPAAPGRAGPEPDARPALIILDEPSIGLDPPTRRTVFHMIRLMNQQGRTILLVEQNARAGLKLSTRGLVLENGRVRLTGTGREILEHPEIGVAVPGRRGRRAVPRPADARPAGPGRHRPLGAAVHHDGRRLQRLRPDHRTDRALGGLARGVERGGRRAPRAGPAPPRRPGGAGAPARPTCTPRSACISPSSSGCSTRPRTGSATERAIDALYRAHRHLDPSAERIEARARRGAARRRTSAGPAGADRPPLVVLIPGLDSTKEEFFH